MYLNVSYTIIPGKPVPSKLEHFLCSRYTESQFKLKALFRMNPLVIYLAVKAWLWPVDLALRKIKSWTIYLATSIEQSWDVFSSMRTIKLQVICLDISIKQSCVVNLRLSFMALHTANSGQVILSTLQKQQ